MNTMNTMQHLLDVMNLGSKGFVGVVRTSDNCYIGMAPGDCGYNHFIGSPSFHPGPGRDRSRKVWEALTPAEQAAVLELAANPLDGAPIPILKFAGL